MKVQDIRNLTRSVCLSNMTCSWHWEVTSVPSPLCSTSSAWRLTLLENCFLFTRVPSTTAGLISVLQRAPTKMLTWHITRLILVYLIHRSHCTMVEDVCEQCWILMDPLGNYGGWPMTAAFARVFQTYPPQINILQPTLRVNFMFFGVFWYQISQRCSGVVYISVKSNSMPSLLKAKLTPLIASLCIFGQWHINTAVHRTHVYFPSTWDWTVCLYSPIKTK